LDVIRGEEKAMKPFEILFFVIAILLIVLSLLTGPKSRGASGAITGGTNMNIFAKTKERGVDKIISIITMICGILFFLFAILARYL
jgi:preprotein translocase subunit SecG